MGINYFNVGIAVVFSTCIGIYFVKELKQELSKPMTKEERRRQNKKKRAIEKHGKYKKKK